MTREQRQQESSSRPKCSPCYCIHGLVFTLCSELLHIAEGGVQRAVFRKRRSAPLGMVSRTLAVEFAEDIRVGNAAANLSLSDYTLQPAARVVLTGIGSGPSSAARTARGAPSPSTPPQFRLHTGALRLRPTAPRAICSSRVASQRHICYRLRGAPSRGARPVRPSRETQRPATPPSWFLFVRYRIT